MIPEPLDCSQPTPYQMKRTLLTMAALAASTALYGIEITQGLTDNYVKFHAGDYDALLNTATSVITDNTDGTLTTSLRDDANAATLIYTIDFAAIGDYTLYFNVGTTSLSDDSMFVATALNTTPTTADNTYRWNNLRNADSNGDGWIALSTTTGSGVAPFSDYGSPVTTITVSATGEAQLIFRPRENGMVWQNFVLSTDSLLTSTDLNTLAYSSVVPEPSTYAAIAGTLALGLAFWRRRR